MELIVVHSKYMRLVWKGCVVTLRLLWNISSLIHNFAFLHLIFQGIHVAVAGIPKVSVFYFKVYDVDIDDFS